MNLRLILHAVPVPVLLLALVWGGTEGAAAQDVEMLGEHYGTRPPEAYFQELARDPNAYQFEREGRDRLLHMQQRRGGSFPDMILRQGEPARSLGPRDVPMVGTFRFPLVLGLFSDSDEEPPYSTIRVREEFFEGPNSYHQTVPELYAEMSGGRVELEGTTFPWVRTGLTTNEVTQGASGLTSSREKGVGAFIEAIVQELDDQGVDWSQYDNTGDGFVDVLSIMHPNSGAECGGGGDRIWSHRWSLRSATQQRLNPGFRTSTPRPDGEGYIYINDYTIQPVLACNNERINEIGVFAHELGHGFGLPDLYGTGTRIRGAGRWDIMGTGTWGCRGEDPSRPCHMSAWTKAMLGWVEVIDVDPGTDLGTVTLPPVQSSGQVLRIPAADGSGQYLLLENRQRIGSDVNLWEPGLLIWHVDPEVVEARWSTNRVNNDPSRLGVWLRQADGLDELAEAGPSHGDPGDPFPGCIKENYQDYFSSSIPCARTNSEFHFGSEPASRTHGGDALGTTITGIEQVGAEPFDVRFDLTTRFSRITLSRDGLEGEGVDGDFQVDGESLQGDPVELEAAPFRILSVEAPPGVELAEGVRRGFDSWSDGGERVRDLEVPLSDTSLVAVYGGDEVRLRWEPTSDLAPGEAGSEVPPGSLETDPASPDLWFPRGTQVGVTATPTPGFSFVDWAGGLAGQPNPATVTMDEPRSVEATFRFEYDVEDPEGSLELFAAEAAEVLLRTSGGTEPIEWTVVEGALPPGMELEGSETPSLRGLPTGMGTFSLRLRARDALGLEARAQLELVVGLPRVGLQELTAPFLGQSGTLTSAQEAFLDAEGNSDGRYDLGDLRAFLRAHPELPERAPDAPIATAAPDGAPGVVLELTFGPDPVISIRRRATGAPAEGGS
jgi:M6 family metalloprotease-like protein